MSRPSEIQDLPVVDARSRCCDRSLYLIAGLSIVAVLGIVAAAYFAGRSHGQANKWQANEVQAFADSLPLIHATAAVSNERFSMATGDVSDDAEGLFVLDHNSGLLQCSVIYPRFGSAFRAKFQVNVAEALGTGAKGGQYMMVTGRAQFPRASNRPAAPSVVYVMDGATGNFACFGIPFDHTAVARNQPQQGLLVLIATGTANPVIDRDDLR